MSQSLLQPHDQPNEFRHEYRSQPTSQPQILSSRSLIQQPPTAPRSGEQNYQKLIELAVQRMRSLENKYEKLSLFYQDELNQEKQQISARGENQTTTSSARRSDGNTKGAAVGSVISALPNQLGPVNSASLNNLSSSVIPRQPSGLSTQREETVLNDLRSEKLKFDDAINFLLREAPKLDIRQSEGPTDQNIGQISLSNDEVIRFNGELQGSFIDLLNHIEQCQSQTVNCIQAKQTEMFSLSNKYRMPTNFRSECVAIWCDTKAQITQNIQQTRTFLHEKGLSLIAQSTKPINPQNNTNSKDRYSVLIDKFEQDLVALKRSTLYYQNNVQHTKNVIKSLDDSIKTDRNRIKSIFNELMDTVSMSNDILLGRGNLQNDVGSLNQQNYGEPGKNSNINPSQSQNNLDKRLVGYARSAINRPNSRSSGISGGQLQRPPIQNQPQSNIVQRRNTNYTGNTGNNSQYGMNNGLISPSRASLSGYSQNTIDQDWHPDLWIIRNRLIEYENQVSSLIAEVNEKEALLEDINILEDKQINEKLSQFLQTHDTDLVKQYFTNTVLTPTEVAHIVAQANLKAIQNNQLNTSQKDNSRQSNSRSPIRNTFGRSVSPYRGNTGCGKDNPSTPTQDKKNTPVRSKQGPPNYNHPHQKTPSNDNINNSVNMALGSNAEQLYIELKRANQKVFEQQADIRKLKDQIQVLNIQAEDLRLTNNRLQIQSQNYSKQLATLNQKLSSKASAGPSNKSASSQQVQSPISKQQLPNNYSYILQERDELLNEEKDLCQKIDQFFSAMKSLQRAVNKKEDISELKVEFELKQRSLQKTSKGIQQRISFSQNPLNVQQTQSVISGSDISQAPGSSLAGSNNLRNRSFDNHNRVGTNTTSVNRDKSKKADILQKQQIQEQIPSPLRPTKPPASVGYQNRISGSLSTQTYSPKPQTIQEAEKMNSSNINNISQGSFQSAGASRSNNQNQVIERKNFEFENSEQDKNLNHLRQVKTELQHLVIGHQQSVAQLAKQLAQWSEQMSPACYKHLHEVFATLDREIDLTLKHALSIDKEQSSQPNSITKLRDLLIHKIQGTETQMAEKLKTIQRRLEQRESELDSVKSLFVEKLKVLESNFAEISEHLLRSQQLQQELEEAKQEVQKHKEEAFDVKSKLELTLKEQKDKQQESNKFFNQYLNEEQEEMIKEQERQIEDLLSTNNQLQEQLVQQKQKCKKHIEESEYLIYKSQILKYEDQIKKESQEKRDLLKNLENLQKDQENLQNEIQKIKSEKVQLNSDLLKAKEGLQQSQILFEKKEMVVAQSVREIEARLKQTQEKNDIAEKENRQNTELIKALEEENELLGSELEELRNKAIQSKKDADNQKLKLKNELEDCEHKITILSKELAEKEILLEKMMQDNDEVTIVKEEIGKKNNAIEKLTSQINDLEQNLAEAQSQQIELSTNAQDQLEHLKKLMNQQIKEEQDKSAKLLADKENEQNKLKEELEKIKELEKQKLKEELEKEKKDEKDQLKSDLEQAKEIEKQKLKNELEEAKINEQQKLKEELEEAKRKEQDQFKLDFEKVKELEKQKLKEELEEVKKQEQQKLKEELEKVKNDEQLKQKEELEKVKEQELIELQNKLQKEKEVHLEEREIKKSKEAENMMSILKSQFLKQLADKNEELQKTKEELEMIQSNFKITDTKKQHLEQIVKEKEDQFVIVKQEVENVKKQSQKERDEVEQKFQQEKESLEEINKIALDEKEQILFQQKEILESKEALEKQKEEITQSAFQLSQEVQELQAKLESIEQAKDHFEKKLLLTEPQVTQLQKDLKESKDNLKEQIQKAENLEKIIKKLEEQKSQNQKDFISSELQFKEQELEQLRKELENIKQLTEVQKKELADKTGELDKIKKAQEQKVNELMEKLKQAIVDEMKLKELNVENSEIKVQLDQVQKKEQISNNKNKELEQSLDKVNTLYNELNAFKNDVEKQKPIQDEQMKSLEAQIKNQIETVELLNKQLSDITQSKETLEKDKKSLEDKFKQLNDDYHKLDEKYKLNIVQLEKAEQEVTQVVLLKQQVQELEDQIDQLQKQLTDSKQIQADLESKLKSKEIDENKTKHELQEISLKSMEIIEQQKQLQVKLQEKSEEIKKMEDSHKGELTKQKEELKKTSDELENNKKENILTKQKLEEVSEDVAAQKIAYETILDELSKSKNVCQEFERQIDCLKNLNRETEQRANELEEQIEILQQTQGQNKHSTRNSIGSDGDEYTSVEEMKTNLKHARQNLIQFLCKMPYSDPNNEMMLPIVLSMFEFTKEEIEQAKELRKKFNDDLDQSSKNDKAKGVFSKMWGTKKDAKDKTNKSGNRIPTDHSFNSGNGANR